jgi:putative transcription factor
MSHPHQDWENITWTKPKQNKENKPKPNKKFNLLDSEDPPPPQKCTLEIRKKIMQGRNIKKWTQKQLADKLNVPASVINNYENGKEKPTNQHIQKLSKLLGVKIN